VRERKAGRFCGFYREELVRTSSSADRDDQWVRKLMIQAHLHAEARTATSQRRSEVQNDQGDLVIRGR
jgi:hypothetical protein